jgi:hypothetical protein
MARTNTVLAEVRAERKRLGIVDEEKEARRKVTFEFEPPITHLMTRLCAQEGVSQTELFRRALLTIALMPEIYEELYDGFAMAMDETDAEQYEETRKGWAVTHPEWSRGTRPLRPHTREDATRFAVENLDALMERGTARRAAVKQNEQQEDAGNAA